MVLTAAPRRPALDSVARLPAAPALASVACRLRAELPLAREIWTLAWPAITHMLLLTLVFLAGRVMVGRSSATALASLQISGTLVYVACSLFTAFSTGTLAVVARRVGAGDRVAAARAARASVLVALALGLAVALPLRVANGALLRLVFPQASPAVLADAAAYLHVVLPVLPLAFVEATAAACLQGAGDTRTPLLVAVAGNVVNLALGWALVFGHLGAPALGVRGAAAGHAATMVIEGVLLSAVLLSRRSPLPLRAVPWGMAGDLRELRRVREVAGPAVVEKAVFHAGFLAFVAILGLLGPEAMAANQALVAIESICFLSADGFGVAASSLVAQKLGAGRPREAERAGLFAAALCAAVLGAFGALFLIAPRLLVRGFVADPDVVALGARALLVAGVAQPFMGFAVVIGMALRGAGDVRTVLLSTVVCALVVRVAATWLFAVTLGYGLAGIWMGSTADWLVRTVMLALAYRRGAWRAVTV